jgi:hypothetical protein
MPEVVPAFVGAEALETLAEQGPEGLDGPAAGCAEDGFQLGEAEFDGIEIWAVRGQIHEGRAGARNRAADAGDFVDVEVVRDDEVPGVERGDENLFDVGQEAGAVNGAIEDARRGQAGDAERGKERTGLPPRAARRGRSA